MRSARSYAVAASTALREKLAYPGNFAAGLLTYGLFVVIFSRIWAVALASKGSIEGYGYAMTIWYFIVAEMSLFAFGRFFSGLSRDVKSGQVAYALSRPYDFVSYHFAERFGGSLADAAIFALEGLALGYLLAGGAPPLPGGGAAGFGVRAARLAWTVLSLLLAGALGYYLQAALAMTAFWAEENDAFFWIYQKIALVAGTLLPVEFLPAAAARAVMWTPFPYLTYAPARIAVAFDAGEALSLVARQAAWLAAAVVLARLVFGAGSRRVALNGG